MSTCIYMYVRTYVLNMYMYVGAADMVVVGCVFIGDSSSEEMARVNASKCQEEGVDPVIMGANYGDQSVEESVVMFEAVNPGNCVYKTVAIRNYRFGNYL